MYKKVTYLKPWFTKSHKKTVRKYQRYTYSKYRPQWDIKQCMADSHITAYKHRRRRKLRGCMTRLSENLSCQTRSWKPTCCPADRFSSCVWEEAPGALSLLFHSPHIILVKNNIFLHVLLNTIRNAGCSYHTTSNLSHIFFLIFRGLKFLKKHLNLLWSLHYQICYKTSWLVDLSVFLCLKHRIYCRIPHLNYMDMYQNILANAN